MKKKRKPVKMFCSVYWEHTMPLWWGEERTKIMAGTIIKIYETTVGGKKKAKVAKISLMENFYWNKLGKKTTVIKFDKLKLL